MDLISAHTAGGERRLPPLLRSGCPVENRYGIAASNARGYAIFYANSRAGFWLKPPFLHRCTNENQTLKGVHYGKTTNANAWADVL